MNKKEKLYDIIRENIIANNCYCNMYCDYRKIMITKGYCILFEEELKLDGFLTYRCEECIGFLTRKMKMDRKEKFYNLIEENINPKNESKCHSTCEYLFDGLYVGFMGCILFCKFLQTKNDEVNRCDLCMEIFSTSEK